MADRLELGVNIDHVATLRQARGTTYPGILEAARYCEAAGAQGMTVHLREDRRHIQDADVYDLRRALNIRLNLEMAINPGIVDIAVDVKPEEACLVPEKREELTTEGGLDVVGQLKDVRAIVERLSAAGIAVSLFIDPEPDQIEAAARVGAPVIELHTGTFCDLAPEGAEAELQRLIRGAEQAHARGIVVNAGHGIHMGNVEQILRIPHLHTLNIGHSIVARAVFIGLEQAVREMMTAMHAYTGGEHA
jgi:pyridoxine 5-phosphate synthase